MATTTGPLDDLLRARDHAGDAGAWRWNVRRHLVPVREGLLREHSHRRNAWLSARATRVVRERDQLVIRLNHLASEVLVAPDVEAVAAQLSRLIGDIERHAQRLHDLAYDDVELEIGGSE
ncbi:hypothetical protein [Nocardioides cynanchi]|uniref:hypothetical protein n=1 Tax=Nocardioides cynanchi TaxID=2558918 RepID=UPI0012453163|nr:hypothetical protein [Nocardioides cynanchi]